MRLTNRQREERIRRDFAYILRDKYIDYLALEYGPFDVELLEKNILNEKGDYAVATITGSKKMFVSPHYFQLSLSERRGILRHEFGHLAFYDKFKASGPKVVKEVYADLFAQHPKIMATKGLNWLKKASTSLKKLWNNNPKWFSKNSMEYMMEDRVINRLNNAKVRRDLRRFRRELLKM